MNAHTELAVLYNDMSPLENHHCAVAFDILMKVFYNVELRLHIKKIRINEKYELVNKPNQ